MALIIYSTTNNPIRIQGTATELASVYNRLEFNCKPNGITMEIAFHTYADHASYVTGNQLPTDLPNLNIIADINLLTQIQDLTAAHELARSYFESLGYVVSIDYLP
jgi:hypothetical protein